MRMMFQTCRLVHADLSEYNILWWKSKAVFIDVSQSVETDHPRALEFLRMDCTNVTDFFRKRKLLVMSPMQLFAFVVHPDLPTPEAEEAYLAEARSAARSATPATAAEEVDAAVFMRVFIPSNLGEVADHERAHDKLARGDTDSGYHDMLTGLNLGGRSTATTAELIAAAAAAAATAGSDEDDGAEVKAGAGAGAGPGPGAGASGAGAGVGAGAGAGVGAGAVSLPAGEGAAPTEPPVSPISIARASAASGSDSDGSDGSDGEEDDEDDRGADDDDKAPGTASFVGRLSTKAERKAHKAKVKELARDKRKAKMPKHLKKRKEKQSKKKAK